VKQRTAEERCRNRVLMKNKINKKHGIYYVHVRTKAKKKIKLLRQRRIVKQE